MIEVKEEHKDAAGYLTHVLDPTLLSSLKERDIVLLPEGEGTDGTLIFRPGTKDFLDYLSSQTGADVHVDIATEDDRYVEQLLHAADTWIPHLLILAENPLVHELVIVTIAHYIIDKLKGLGKHDQSQTIVRSTIVIKRKNETASFTYEGPPEAFEATMRNAINVSPGKRK